jgi:signal transduction histidine kinase
VFDFILPEYHEQAQKDFTAVRDGHDNYPVTYRINTFTGRELWIECIGTTIMFGGKPALLISLRDITSRKIVDDALRKANQKLNILSSITRHDIVNELLSLDAYSSFLRKKLGDNTEALELLSRIQRVSRKIGDQIRFTKEYQDLGVNDPVWQNVATIAKMAAYDTIPDGMTLDIGTGSLEIFADPMLMLVFYNLFENARRHGEKVTRLSVSFFESSGYGILIIEDDGVGIPRELKSKIFEKGVGKNTGFGLFLAREILQITGLVIGETGSPGTGARFEIQVPAGRWRMQAPGETALHSAR